MVSPVEISIIIPILNEQKYIRKLIDSVLADGHIDKELLLVDGGSTDGTIETITEYIAHHPNIQLVHNPEKYVSPGFNKAYKLAKGKYITLMGAHAIYPENYFSIAIHHLTHSDCDAVGGPLLQDAKTNTGKAIAYCMSAKFGVGGTEFRTERKQMYVDSVAFAVYKRDVFEKAGLLDEQLIRNQDDEFHYRLNASGFKILMVPEMECTYFVRENIKSLFSQYFQYGYYKPLVIKKVRSGLRLRHLIPAAFVLYFISAPVAFLFWSWVVPMIIYILLNVYFSFNNNLTFSQKITCLLIFPVLHISYGSGYLAGLSKLI